LKYKEIVFDGSVDMNIPAAIGYTTPPLPGFELPLAQLFAAADDWK